MIFNWLDAGKAVEFGISLADQLALQVGAESLKSGETKSEKLVEALREVLSRADRTTPTGMNFYRKAKLANSFKWRLMENGVERVTADELTQSLVLNMSVKAAGQPATDQMDGARGSRPETINVKQLLARGNKCLAQGANIEALEIFECLLEIEPHHAVALNNAAAALSKLSRYREAEKYLRAAIKQKPDFADAYSNLGAGLRCRGYVDESEESLRIALRLNPSHVDARINLGMTLVLLNRIREAKGQFSKVLKARPRSAEALFGMGQIAYMDGRFEESAKLLRRAIDVSPKMPDAWAALSGLRKMTPSDEPWLRSVEEIARSGLPPIEAAMLRFAMGKYHDDVGQFPQAFANYRDANELLKPIATKYDRAARTAFVDELIRLYSRENLAAARGVASNSMKPIFVVGMMRSGTSLTEQIIASHPMAAGAGELDYWGKVVHEHRATILLGQDPFDEAAKKRMAEAYLSDLDKVSSIASRVVDKAPLNSDYLGTIYSIFPNARIIYMQRDPIDTCLSCYFQNLSLAHNFTLDLSDLAHYYQEHHRLMNHWRAVLPEGSILDVPYEELVADQEGWSRKMLAFVGLEWDDRCLDFQATERPIVTASFWQARQKIFKTSVRRWRNYKKYIDPLLNLETLHSGRSR